MVEGKTILIYKKDDEKFPKNYRPITYLSVITKLITFIVAKRMQKNLYESHEYDHEWEAEKCKK